MKTAADIMTREVITIRSHQSLRELAELLADKKISGCPVLGSEGEIVGVVSASDLVRDQKQSLEEAFFRFAVGFGEDLLETDPWDSPAGPDAETLAANHDVEAVVATVMSRAVHSIPAETPIQEVARAMLERKVHRLLVTEEDRFVGLVSVTDLVRTMAEGV